MENLATMSNDELMALRKHIDMLLKNDDAFWHGVKMLNEYQDASLASSQKLWEFENKNLYFKALDQLGFGARATCIEANDTLFYYCSIYNLDKTTTAMREEGLSYGLSVDASKTFSFMGYVKPSDEEIEKITRIIFADYEEIKTIISSNQQDKISDFIAINKES